MTTPEAEYVDPRQFLGAFKTALWFPQYRVSASGPWDVRVAAMAASRGYWGDVYGISGAVILMGPGADGAASWMSSMPWEIESQEIGLAAARGHTVVLGLGMGWQAANAALQKDVTHVTVIERDGSIIELVRDQRVFEQLPADARAKIELVQADANIWRPTVAVDTMLADIWEKTDDPQRLSDVRRMHDNIGAKAVYFWGQEIQLWRCSRKRRDAAFDWSLIRAIIAEDFHMPLVVPDWPDYPEKIAAAARWWAPPGLT